MNEIQELLRLPVGTIRVHSSYIIKRIESGFELIILSRFGYPIQTLNFSHKQCDLLLAEIEIEY